MADRDIKLDAAETLREVEAIAEGAVDLSSWITGRCCELAARGYSRDRKKGLPQINYGDIEAIRQSVFDAGSLFRPYHSVNTDINKRIRYIA